MHPYLVYTQRLFLGQMYCMTQAVGCLLWVLFLSVFSIELSLHLDSICICKPLMTSLPL
jgi:hypothetical protein